MLKFGFTIFELLIVLLLTGILGFAVYQTLDFAEQKNKIRDERYKNSAQILVEGLQKYHKQFEKLPWQPQNSLALPWTRIADTQVGICADKNCSTFGSISQVGGLPSDFKTSDFMTSDDPNEQMVIAKGEQTKDSVYVCFVPKSKTFRLNWVDLKDVRLGEQINKSGEARDCPAQPDWTNSTCYYCVSGNVNP